mgnify:CR=1 FL=1
MTSTLVVFLDLRADHIPLINAKTPHPGPRARLPCDPSVARRGIAGVQVRHQRLGHLPEQSLPLRRGPAAADGRTTERRAAEKAAGRGQRPGGTARGARPGDSAPFEPGRRLRAARAGRTVQVRWAHPLLPDDLVRRGQVLPAEMPGRQDGR